MHRLHISSERMSFWVQLLPIWVRQKTKQKISNGTRQAPFSQSEFCEKRCRNLQYDFLKLLPIDHVHNHLEPVLPELTPSPVTVSEAEFSSPAPFAVGYEVNSNIG